MFELIPFEPEHIIPLAKEPMNANIADWYESGYAKAAKELTQAVTGLVDGEIIGCCGVLEMWTGRGHIWTVVSERVRKNPVQIFKGMRRYFDSLNFRRLEMDIPIDLEVAHRRAIFMGFELETPLARKFLPDGKDASIYVRVRD